MSDKNLRCSYATVAGRAAKEVVVVVVAAVVAAAAEFV